jgi:hypothetical protein
MAKNFKLQIKGLVRFSYPSVGGFAISSVGPEKLEETLYDADRLERRFRLFEHLALHSLALQDEDDFRVGILIGDSFPAAARDRLAALVDDFPQARIIVLPAMGHIQAVNAAFAAMTDNPDATHTATFRLDDDDAMHRTTTRRIAELAPVLTAARDPKRPLAIAFNRGLYWDVGDAKEPLTERYENTPLGVGLALVTPVSETTNVFRRNHRKLGQFYDCYTEVDRPMFIRSVHQDNDSAAKATGRKGTMTRRAIAKHLRSGFGMTPDHLGDI